MRFRCFTKITISTAGYYRIWDLIALLPDPDEVQIVFLVGLELAVA